jgi:hypothetical protein
MRLSQKLMKYVPTVPGERNCCLKSVRKQKTIFPFREWSLFWVHLEDPDLVFKEISENAAENSHRDSLF